ncbi:uncharacterized protein LOC125032095 [Penaeus chinensis]|uniref:uncharacterized protein LOC125032095 n=1 Tax=Penaeus chinensis TaxID=139456 RepID=UPI001FB7B1F9|nr:uncharacterized protein LOC125032095 [Penaeus chinensis]
MYPNAVQIMGEGSQRPPSISAESPSHHLSRPFQTHFKKQLISSTQNSATVEGVAHEEQPKSTDPSQKHDQSSLGRLPHHESAPVSQPNPQPNRFEAYQSSSTCSYAGLVPRPGALLEPSFLKMNQAVPQPVILTQNRQVPIGHPVGAPGPSPVVEHDTRSVDSLGSVELPQTLPSHPSGTDLDDRLPATPYGHIRLIRGSPASSSSSKSRSDWSRESTPSVNSFKIPSSSPFSDPQTQQTSPLSLVIQKVNSGGNPISTLLHDDLINRSSVQSGTEVTPREAQQTPLSYVPAPVPLPVQEISVRDKRFVPIRKRSVQIVSEDNKDSEIQCQGTFTSQAQVVSLVRLTPSPASCKENDIKPPEESVQSMAPPSVPGITPLLPHPRYHPHALKMRPELGGRAIQMYKERPFMRGSILTTSKAAPPPLLSPGGHGHRAGVYPPQQPPNRPHIGSKEDLTSQNMGKEDQGHPFWRYGSSSELRESPFQMDPALIPLRWPGMSSEIAAQLKAPQNLAPLYRPGINSYLFRGGFAQGSLIPPNYPSQMYQQPCSLPEGHRPHSNETAVKPDCVKETKPSQEVSPDDSPINVVDEAPELLPASSIGSEGSKLEGLGKSLQHHLTSQKLLTDGKAKVPLTSPVVHQNSSNLLETTSHTGVYGLPRSVSESILKSSHAGSALSGGLFPNTIMSGNSSNSVIGNTGGGSLSCSASNAVSNIIETVNSLEGTANVSTGGGSLTSQDDECSASMRQLHPTTGDLHDDARHEQAGKLGKFLKRVNRGSVDHPRTEASTPVSIIGGEDASCVGTSVADQIMEDVPSTSKEEQEAPGKESTHCFKEPNFEVSLSETQLRDLRSIHQDQETDRQFSRGFKKSISSKFEDDNASTEVDVVTVSDENSKTPQETENNPIIQKSLHSDNISETLSILQGIVETSREQFILEDLDEDSQKQDSSKAAKEVDLTQVGKSSVDRLKGFESSFHALKTNLLQEHDDSDADSVRNMAGCRIITRRSSSSSQASDTSRFSVNSPPPCSLPRSSDGENTEDEMPQASKELTTAEEKSVPTVATCSEGSNSQISADGPAVSCKAVVEEPTVDIRVPSTEMRSELVSLSECCNEVQEVESEVEKSGSVSHQDPKLVTEPDIPAPRSPALDSSQKPDSITLPVDVSKSSLVSQSNLSAREVSDDPPSSESLTGKEIGGSTPVHEQNIVSSDQSVSASVIVPADTEVERPKLVLKLKTPIKRTPTKGALKAFSEELIQKVVETSTPDSSSEVTSTTPDNPVVYRKPRGRPPKKCKPLPPKKSQYTRVTQPETPATPIDETNTQKNSVVKENRTQGLSNKKDNSGIVFSKPEPAPPTRLRGRRACANVSYAEFFDADALTPSAKVLPPVPQFTNMNDQLSGSVQPSPNISNVMQSPGSAGQPVKRRRGRPKKINKEQEHQRLQTLPDVPTTPAVTPFLAENVSTKENLNSSILGSGSAKDSLTTINLNELHDNVHLSDDTDNPTPTKKGRMQTQRRLAAQFPNESLPNDNLEKDSNTIETLEAGEMPGKTTELAGESQPLDTPSPQLTVVGNKESKLKITIRRTAGGKRTADSTFKKPPRKRKRNDQNLASIENVSSSMTVDRQLSNLDGKESPEAFPLHCDPHDPLGIDCSEETGGLGKAGSKNVYEFEEDVSDEDVPVAQRLKSWGKTSNPMYKRARKIVQNAIRTPVRDPNFSYLRTPSCTPCHTPGYMTPSYISMPYPIYTPEHRVTYSGPGSTPRGGLKIRLRKKPRQEQLILRIKKRSIPKAQLQPAVPSKSTISSTSSSRVEEENNNSKEKDGKDTGSTSTSCCDDQVPNSRDIQASTSEKSELTSHKDASASASHSSIIKQSLTKEKDSGSSKRGLPTLIIKKSAVSGFSSSLEASDKQKGSLKRLKQTEDGFVIPATPVLRLKRCNSHWEQNEEIIIKDRSEDEPSDIDQSASYDTDITTDNNDGATTDGGVTESENADEMIGIAKVSPVIQTPCKIKIKPPIPPDNIEETVHKLDLASEGSRPSNEKDKITDAQAMELEDQLRILDAPVSSEGVAVGNLVADSSNTIKKHTLQQDQTPQTNMEKAESPEVNTQHDKREYDLGKQPKETQNSRDENKRKDITQQTEILQNIPTPPSSVSVAETSPTQNSVIQTSLQTTTQSSSSPKPSQSTVVYSSVGKEVFSLPQTPKSCMPQNLSEEGDKSKHEKQSSAVQSSLVKDTSPVPTPIQHGTPTGTPHPGRSVRVDSVELELAAILGSPNKSSERIETPDARAMNDEDLEALLLGDKSNSSVRSETPTTLQDVIDKKKSSSDSVEKQSLASEVYDHLPCEDSDHQMSSSPELFSKDTNCMFPGPIDLSVHTLMVRDRKLKTPPKVLLQKLSPKVIGTLERTSSSSPEANVSTPKKFTRRAQRLLSTQVVKPTQEDTEKDCKALPDKFGVRENVKKRILASPPESSLVKKPRRSERNIRSEGTVPMEAKLSMILKERRSQYSKSKDSSSLDSSTEELMFVQDTEPQDENGSSEAPINESEPKEKLNSDKDGKDNTGDKTVEDDDVLPSVHSSFCETESPHSENVKENPVLGSEEKCVSSKNSGAQEQLSYIKTVSLHTDDSNSSNLEESLNSDIESSSVRSDSSKSKDQEAMEEVQQKEPETRMTLRQSSRLRRQPLHVPHRRGRGRGRGISRPKRTRIKTLAVINSSTDSQDENDTGFTSGKRHASRLGPRKHLRNLRKHRQISTDDDDGFSDPDVNKKTAKNLIFNSSTFQAMLKRSSSRIMLDDAEEEEKSQDVHSPQQPVLTKSPQSKNEDQADGQETRNSDDVSPKVDESNVKDTKSTPSVELDGSQLTENPKENVPKKTASTEEISESITSGAKRLNSRETANSDKNIKLPVSKIIAERSQGEAQEHNQDTDKRLDENCDSENADHKDSSTQGGSQDKLAPAAHSERNLDDDIEETLRRLDGPSPRTVLRSPPQQERNCTRKLLTEASGDQARKETESSTNETAIKNNVESNLEFKKEVERKETSDQDEIIVSSEQPMASILKPSTSKEQEKSEQLAVEDSLKEADGSLNAESSKIMRQDTPALSSAATSDIVSENTSHGKENSSDNGCTNTNDGENSHGGSGTGGDEGGNGNDSGSNSNSPVRNVLLKSVQYSDGINDHDSEYHDSMWNMAFLTPERRERDEISPPQPSSPGRSDSNIRRNLSRQQLYPAIVTLQPGSFESPVRRERSDSSFNLHIPSYSEMEERGPSGDENVEIIFEKKSSAKEKECAISKEQRLDDNQQVCSRDEGSSVSGEDCASQSISSVVVEEQEKVIKALDDKENSPRRRIGNVTWYRNFI